MRCGAVRCGIPLLSRDSPPRLSLRKGARRTAGIGETYPEEALEIHAAGVERAVEVVYGVLDRVVFRH